MFGTHLGCNHTETTKNTHLESLLVLSLEPNTHSAPNQKNKVESWRLFISNRAARACVIDARQTMHVSEAGAWERGDGFQMRDVLLLSSSVVSEFAVSLMVQERDGGGAATLLSNIWSKLTSCST